MGWFPGMQMGVQSAVPVLYVRNAEPARDFYAHAEEALIDAPGSFIASEDASGLGPWLSNRAAKS